MFKKIEIWILYLCCVLGVFFIIVFGALVRHEIHMKESRFPVLSAAALFLAEIPSNLMQISKEENPFLAIDRFPEKGGFSGTPLDDQSYLLLSRYDGDISESIVELVDLTTFNVLHSWNPDITHVNSLIEPSNQEFQFVNRDSNEKRYRITHPLLDSAGNLYFQFKNMPLVKIDYCSKLVWQNQEERFHHSQEFDAEGNIWVPTHQFPFSVSKKYIGDHIDNYLDDALTKVSQEGKILFQKSVSELFIENNMGYLLFATGGHGLTYDPIHLNDIQPVLNNGKYWNKGDVFLSLRNQSMLILYRPANDKIVWIGKGYFFQQHDVNLLNQYQISIFNNNSVDTINGTVVDGNNEVIIYDMSTDMYTKYMDKSLIENDVRTTFGGRSHILDNGDLYIEETQLGRTIYFDSNGSLRWEHVNRASDGKPYQVSWSRILYNPKEVAMVQNILEPRIAAMSRIRICIFLVLIGYSTYSLAYIGPGMGGGVIAAVIGIIGALLLALFGIIYYPIKRMIKNRRTNKCVRDKDKEIEEIEDTD